VTLKCGEWDKKSDVWGIGCIILELITGTLFFATHDTYEHLAMIEKVSGPMPSTMIRITRNRDCPKWYELSEQKFEMENSYMRWPENVHDQESVDYVQNMPTIEDIVSEDEPELRDL